MGDLTYSSRAAVTGSANSIAEARSATVIGITSLASLEMVRTLHSGRSASSTRRGHPDLDIVG